MSAVAGREAAFAPTAIGFTLDEAGRQALGTRASSMGVSPHELACHYVLQQLQESEDRQVLHEGMKVLHHELNELRLAMAIAVQALLTSAGKISESKATEWSRPRDSRRAPGNENPGGEVCFAERIRGFRDDN